MYVGLWASGTQDCKFYETFSVNAYAGAKKTNHASMDREMTSQSWEYFCRYPDGIYELLEYF